MCFGFVVWSVCDGQDLVRPNWHYQWHLMPTQVQEPDVQSWVPSSNLELMSWFIITQQQDVWIGLLTCFVFIKYLGYVLVHLYLSIRQIISVNNSVMTSS